MMSQVVALAAGRLNALVQVCHLLLRQLGGVELALRLKLLLRQLQHLPHLQVDHDRERADE